MKILKINTIGIWLPPGYTYKPNQQPGLRTSHQCISRRSRVVWTFSAVNFTSLPGVSTTDSPMTAKITFNYSPLYDTFFRRGRALQSNCGQHDRISEFRQHHVPKESCRSLIRALQLIPLPVFLPPVQRFDDRAHNSRSNRLIPTKPDSVSWINTSNVTGLSYTWDDTVRVFHITSIGSTTCTTLTNPVSIGSTTLNVASTSGFPDSGSLTVSFEPASVTYTGKTSTSFTGIPGFRHRIDKSYSRHGGTGWFDATSTDTYVAKSELRKIGGALNGDYYATGNSLMRDRHDGVKETKVNSSAIVAAPNPTGADNGVPDDANVSASYLYWGTWYMSDNWASQNNINSSNYAQRCHTLFTDHLL